MSPIYHYLCASIAAVVAKAGEVDVDCRTRFTFSRPTRENAASILVGASAGGSDSGDFDSSKISFNHDQVGITQPTKSSCHFPSCVGYPAKTEQRFARHNHTENETLCSSMNHNGWRILRFQKRVGAGKLCYRRVQDAVFKWDFEQKGKKSMGILSATSEKSPCKYSGVIDTRKKLLATFTEFRNPFKSLFVVNPVAVVHEMKDASLIPKCLSSTTSYATLLGHLLAGEERVTVIWRQGMGGSVDVEVVSFSRAAPSIGGKLVWPLIGRMQKQFFLAEVNHLCEVGHAK